MAKKKITLIQNVEQILNPPEKHLGFVSKCCRSMHAVCSHTHTHTN